jgi:predicted ATP-grasp superfamily ATP-dependent carboligase
MKIDVLLTDGNYKNTYVILRALKKQGLKVGVLYNSFLSLSFFSRFPDKRYFISTDLLKDSSEESYILYKSELLKILQKDEIRVFMPVGNLSFRFASKYEDELKKYTRVPVAKKEIMEIAQNKMKTFEFAEKIGIPIPKTIYIKDSKDILTVSETMNYPCVIKKTNFYEGGVIYCNNKFELKENLNRLINKMKTGASYPIIQEYIEGPGTGFYGIFKDGKCINFFMHERIREYPTTGGASTFAKSVYSENLRKLGTKLLECLGWSGVAMVEFKKDNKDGNYKLMEINPKFWGSLELSYRAGINFPYLNYLIALDEVQEFPSYTYKNDVYFRWIIPDDMLWKKFASIDQKKKFKEVQINNKIYNNLHWDDPLTIVFNLFITLYKLFTEKKFPHGNIKKL